MSTLTTCTAATRPAAPFLQDGDTLFETDTKRIITWDANATTWNIYNSDGSFNPNVNIPNTSAMHFDGTDDILTCTGNSRLNISGDVTMAGWINHTGAITSWSGLISWGEGSSRKSRSLGLNGSDRLCFNSWGAHFSQQGDTVMTVDGQWHHIACTIRANGTGIRLFLDGVRDHGPSTFDGGGPIDPYVYNTTEIGGAYTPGAAYFTQGNIDEVSVWDKYLDEAEIAEISSSRSGYDLTANNAAYVSSSDLKGWWRMGDGTGDTTTLIKDLSTTNPLLQNDMVPSGALAPNNTPQFTSVTMPF